MGLFTTHYHSHSNNHTHSESLVPYEKTVHEHRAPTDESVKLLNEFQDKAIDNILKQFRINDNIIEAEGFFIGYSVIHKIILHCRFKVNGKEFHLKEEIDCWEFRNDLSKYFNDESDYQNKVLLLIYKHLSELIAKEIMMTSKEELNSFVTKNYF